MIRKTYIRARKPLPGLAKARKKQDWKAAGNLLFGAMVLVGGSGFWSTGVDSKTGIPVFNWVGLLAGVAGLLFFGYGIFLLVKPARPGQECDLICPKCESVLNLPPGKKHACPHDGTVMEPLAGYYERHPDRRDGPVTPNKE